MKKKVFAVLMAALMVAAMFAGCGNNAKGMTIEEGKLADVILLDTTKAHFGPVHDVIQNIVYCGKENDVETVIINGRIVPEITPDILP